MPDLRPVVSDEQVLTLLNKHFTTPILNLTPLEGGQVARTFSFHTGKQEYVVRFNYDKMLTSNFPKEAYLYSKLASTFIPISPILQVGRLNDLHFAILQRAPGKMLEQHSPQQVEQLLPDLIELLDTIHHVDISETQGYGVLNYHGEGMSTSWPKHLLMVDKEESEQNYFGKWHHLFDDTFLEREIFTEIYQRMQALLDYCPNERYLLHGGYSLRNILAKNGKITAVLDWINAQYGDFVYDIALWDYWCSWLHIGERCQQYYQERNVAVPHYAERLLCYQCYHALDGLRFFAKGGNEEAYHIARAIILQKIGAFGG
ncbi:MAG: phosphotransferase family protein [Ktedonobacteraceae bacterium]